MIKTNHAYRIIISGGGTGGHIYPAIAIADALRALNPLSEVLFVGARDRMEMQLVPKAGYKILGLDISGIQRSLSLKNLMFPFRLIKSIWKSKQIIRDFAPDAAVGVGGYASGPLLYAASALGIPSLIQEQNSYAGLTNKWLGKRVDQICVAYPQMERFFGGKSVMVLGNPVRKDLQDLSSKKAEALAHFGLNAELPVILMIGGSLGARTLNESALANLEMIEGAEVQFIWQTGKGYYERLNDEIGDQLSPKIKLLPFLDRMDLAYAAADVVISRAGALSISELCLAGKSAILVPSPNVTEDHQNKNAEALVVNNAAIKVLDSKAKEFLFDQAIDLIKDDVRRKGLEKAIVAFGFPDAAEHIAQEVIKLINR